MITAEHFKDIRLGRTVSVDGFILIPVHGINQDPNKKYERMVSYETIAKNYRDYPFIFSCSIAALTDDCDSPQTCFFQIGSGSPKEYHETLNFIEKNTIGEWCFVKNGTFIFADTVDASIVSSYLHS